MKLYKNLFAIVITAITLAGRSADAATVEDGWKYYDESNFSKAAEVFRSLSPIPPQILGALCQMAIEKSAISDPKADLNYCTQGVAANDLNSLVWMGIAQFNGDKHLSVERNETLGLGYLSRAVIANYPVASNVLCDYFYGKSDFGKAAPFCKVAAASKFSVGLYHLANMSLEGKGAIQDFKRGRNFALVAASLNSYPAYMLLGDIAKSGKYGQPKDLVAAYSWYVLAGAANPDSDEPQKLRNALGLDASKIETAQKMATTWKKNEPAKWRVFYPTSAK